MLLLDKFSAYIAAKNNKMFFVTKQYKIWL